MQIDITGPRVNVSRLSASKLPYRPIVTFQGETAKNKIQKKLGNFQDNHSILTSVLMIMPIFIGLQSVDVLSDTPVQLEKAATIASLDATVIGFLAWLDRLHGKRRQRHQTD